MASTAKHGVYLVVVSILAIVDLTSAKTGLKVQSSSSENYTNILRTCCPFQNSFLNGSCNNSKKTKESRGLPFPAFINLGSSDDTIVSLKFGKVLSCHHNNYMEEAKMISLDEEIPYTNLHTIFSSNESGMDDKKLDQEGSTKVLLHMDGALEMLHRNVVLSPDNYCVDSYTEKLDGNALITLFSCAPHCSLPQTRSEKNKERERPCIKKCLAWKKHFKCHNFNNCTINSNQSNKPLSHLKDPSIYESYQDFEIHRERINIQIDAYPDCQPKTNLQDDFKILETGEIKIRYKIDSWFKPENYCLEERLIVDDNDIIQNKELIILYCPEEIEELLGGSRRREMIYSIVSWIFILISLGVYGLVWKKHSIHGWTQVAFLISAFLYFFMRSILVLIQLKNSLHLSSWIPQTLDTFFTFGLFTNLVTLNFFFLWNLCKMQLIERVITSWEDLRSLYISQLICYGLSGTIVILPLFMANHEIVDKIEKYFFISLLSLNILIVLSTFVFICKHLLHREKISNQSYKLVKIIKIFLKLLCISGSIWTFKILEQLGKQDVFENNWFWNILQFLTYTYGVNLFILFVLNKITWKKLVETYPQLKPGIITKHEIGCAIGKNKNIPGESARLTQFTNLRSGESEAEALLKK